MPRFPGNGGPKFYNPKSTPSANPYESRVEDSGDVMTSDGRMMPAFGKAFGGGGGRGGFFKRQNFQKSYQNNGGGGGGDKPYNSYKSYGNNNYGNNSYGNNSYGNKSYGNNNYGNNYNNNYKPNNNWQKKEEGGEGGGGYQNNYSGGYGAKWSFAGQKRNAGAPPPTKKAEDSSPKPDLVVPKIY
jgi:hypothetical protein